jgi:hypothetical protein
MYCRLTELAADCYWEQDEEAEVTSGYCPMPEILGQRNGSGGGAGWDAAQCQVLQERVAARQQFLDLIVHRLPLRRYRSAQRKRVGLNRRACPG